MIAFSLTNTCMSISIIKQMPLGNSPKQKGFSSLVLPKLALDHMSSHIGLAPALVSILLDWAKSKLGRATGAAEKHSNLASCRDRFGATLISD